MIVRLDVEEKIAVRRKASATPKLQVKSAAPLPYIFDPCFIAPGTEEVLWGAGCKEILVARYRPYCSQVEPCLETSRTGKPMAYQDEKTLFLRYNYAKHRLWQLEQLGVRCADRDEKKALWQRRAELTREKIATANMALATAMARRIHGTECEFEDLLSEGYIALLHCIEKFDVARGFKFSTYVCRAMLSRYYRMSAAASVRHQRFPLEYKPEMDHSDFADIRREEDRQYAIEAIRKVIAQNDAALTPDEQTVVTGRFLTGNSGKPVTLKNVARQMSLSPERVRQIHQKSIFKLRAVLVGS